MQNPHNIPDDLLDEINEIDSLLIEISERLQDVWRGYNAYEYEADEMLTDAIDHIEQAQYLTSSLIED